MCIFLMEKYSLSPGMLAATVPLIRNALCKHVRGAPFLAIPKVIIVWLRQFMLGSVYPVFMCPRP